uniref:Uncharacterized protein n=1 Tax=Arundo donax TaxID=35708 RepID=A0A0A9FPM7_ARUDO
MPFAGGGIGVPKWKLPSREVAVSGPRRRSAMAVPGDDITPASSTLAARSPPWRRSSSRSSASVGWSFGGIRSATGSRWSRMAAAAKWKGKKIMAPSSTPSPPSSAGSSPPTPILIPVA